MALKVIIVFAIIAASGSVSLPNNIEERLENEIVYEKWHNLDKTIKEFVNYGMKLALPSIIRATSEMNLTSTCRKQGFEFAVGLRNLREWAIKFVDSTGKGIDGFLSGTLSAFGNYDGCLSAVATRSKSGGQGDVMFRGKYCVVEFRPILPIKEKKVYSFADKIEGLMAATKNGSDLIKMIAARAHLFYTGSINIGICVPSGCSKDDLEQLIKYFADTVYLDSKVATCEERVWKYNTFFIVSTFFYALATFLVAFATTLHLYAQHKNIKIQSKALKLLMAFSFLTSFQKLFNTEVANKSFAFLNGMRFLAMAWIVFSHTYMASLAAFPLQSPRREPADTAKAKSDSRNLIYVYGSFSNYFSHLMQQIITSGVLSVSTFLFIGGLLNCYSRVKELEIKKRQSNVFVYIFYRMWRIYPAYIYAIFFVMVLQTLNNGPMYASISYDYARGCDEKWWRNVLFINNLFPVGESCLGHFWYLAVDMQLYLASQITIPVLLKWPRFGILLNAFIILMSIAFSAFYTWFYNLPPSLVTSYTDKQEIFDYWNVHAHPGMNASQYFLGILVGYLLTTKKQTKIPRVALWIGWPLSFIFGCSAIFGRKKWNAGVMPTDLERILFASLAKPTFTLGVAWVVICCATGHGGIVNYILSRTMWIPLSRLSFLIFLVSYTLQTNFVSSFRNVSDISHLILIWRFFGDIFISTFVAFVVCILVEAPFLTLQKFIFSRVKRDLQETESPNNFASDINNYNVNGHVMKIIA